MAKSRKESEAGSEPEAVQLYVLAKNHGWADEDNKQQFLEAGTEIAPDDPRLPALIQSGAEFR